MKRFLVTALATAMIAVSLVGCGADKDAGKENGAAVEDKYEDVSPKAIVEEISTEYVRMPMVIDETMAAEMFHINADDVEEYAISKTGMSPGVGFIMVAKAKEGKLDAVKATFDQVLADQVNAAFYPDEKEIAESAEVRVDGNVVSLMIFHSEVSADVEAAYDAALNK